LLFIGFFVQFLKIYFIEFPVTGTLVD